MLKAKFGYRYPVPHDVKKIRTTYTKRISAVKEELVTEDIDVVRTLYGTRLNVETVKAIEFETSAGLDLDLPRDGLVLEFLMFEGAGTTLHDTSRVSPPNNGTIYGAVWNLWAGKWVLTFDGVDDWVNCGDIGNFAELTVIFWIKTTETRDWKYPIAKEGAQPFSAGVKGWRFNLGVAGSQTNFDLSESLTNYSRVNGGPINDGMWHFVTLWWDGSLQRIYVDCVKKDEKPFSGDISNTKYVSIGCCYGPSAFFMGQIGLVAIYSCALSESEIAEIFELTRVYFGV